MNAQARYDAYLAAIPALFAVGASVTAIASGTMAILAAMGTAVVGAGAVGRALFVSPPTETSDC